MQDLDLDQQKMNADPQHCQYKSHTFVSLVYEAPFGLFGLFGLKG
jgi:hypothetical protein